MADLEYWRRNREQLYKWLARRVLEGDHAAQTALFREPATIIWS